MARLRFTPSSVPTYLVVVLALLPKGANAGAPAFGDSAHYKGCWGQVISTFVAPVHVSLLPNGAEMLQGRHGNDHWNNYYQWFSPESTTVRMKISGNPDDLFCSGHVGMSDGRVFFNGGTGANVQGYSYDHTASFVGCSGDVCFQDAFDQLDSNHRLGRYYPTCTVLSSGKVLVLGDNRASTFETSARRPEIYNPATETWSYLSGAIMCDPDAAGCTDSTTNYWVYNYPFMFQLSNGKVLYAGGDEDASVDAVFTRLLTVSGSGSWRRLFADSDVIPGRSGVMYDKDKVLKAGGIDAGDLNRVYRIDLGAESPAWQEMHRMHSHGGGSGGDESSFQLVTLPDQTVLAIGGLSGNGEVPERLDPTDTTSVWQRMNATATERGYHATSLLLPDGGVVFASGDSSGADTERPSLQVFYPPYLYRSNDSLVTDANRPQVSNEPSAIATGTTFIATVTAGSGASSVSKACLMRLGSTTHFFDQGARYLPLSFSSSSNTRTVTAPATPEEAPPGYYMLFFLNNNGVPSHAKFVQVWSVMQSSLTASVSLPEDSIVVTIDWDTNVDAPGGDSVVFYRVQSGGSPVSPVWTGADQRSNNNWHHQKVYKFTPCDTGYWYYEVQSIKSGSTGKSTRTTLTRFKTNACVTP